MKYYLAPMEGVTSYVYRNAHYKCFPSVDKYFTPFLSPNQTRKLTNKEVKEILPECNQKIPLVPQLLSNHAENFMWAANRCQELGYDEINLNLGCPSATVVSKKRGSGFLAYPDELKKFLEEISAGMERNKLKFSIKTRIGKESPEEFEDLLQIYNQFPLSELIIHPRLQTDFYKYYPNQEIFRNAYDYAVAPLCYNGDVFTREQCQAIELWYPNLLAVMMGRGAIANPNLIEEIKIGKDLDKKSLRQFHDEVVAGYQEVLSGNKNALFKMKELWGYMGCIFEDSQKPLKKIRKANNMEDYQDAVNQLFEEKTFTTPPSFIGWRP